MMKVVSLFFTGLMLCTVSAIAQPAAGTSSDTNMEILKEKLKADKKLLVAGNMVNLVCNMPSPKNSP